MQLSRDVHVVAAERGIGSQREFVAYRIEDLRSVDRVPAAIFAASDQHLATGEDCCRMVESRDTHRSNRRERIRREIE